MLQLLILLCLTQIPDRTIYITVNSSFESQLLISELTRDWTEIRPELREHLTEKQIQEIITKGKEFNRIKNRISFKFVQLIDAPLRVQPLSYKYGKYGVWEKIDDNAFLTSTYPLKTISYLYEISQEHITKKTIESNNSEMRSLYYEQMSAWRNKLNRSLKKKYKFYHLYVVRSNDEQEYYDHKLKQWVLNDYDAWEDMYLPPDTLYEFYDTFEIILTDSMSQKIISLTEEDLDVELRQIPLYPRPQIYHPPILPWEE